MNESQVIAKCQKNDRRAQKALYESYAPKMMAVCMRYSKDYETARDLLHDGFIQVFQKIKLIKFWLVVLSLLILVLQLLPMNIKFKKVIH